MNFGSRVWDNGLLLKSGGSIIEALVFFKAEPAALPGSARHEARAISGNSMGSAACKSQGLIAVPEQQFIGERIFVSADDCVCEAPDRQQHVIPQSPEAIAPAPKNPVTRTKTMAKHAAFSKRDFVPMVK